MSSSNDTQSNDPAPLDHVDPVIEVYKKDVDRTLLRENLKLTHEERIRKAESFHRSIDLWRGAAARMAAKANERIARDGSSTAQ